MDKSEFLVWKTFILLFIFILVAAFIYVCFRDSWEVYLCCCYKSSKLSDVFLSRKRDVVIMTSSEAPATDRILTQTEGITTDQFARTKKHPTSVVSSVKNVPKRSGVTRFLQRLKTRLFFRRRHIPVSDIEGFNEEMASRSPVMRPAPFNPHFSTENTEIHVNE